MDALTVPSVSKQTDRAYATLGRALSLASSFEADCRLVAFSLKLKEPYPVSDDIKAYTKFLETLKAAQDVIVSGLDLSENYTDLLLIARNARNFVAHEAGEDIETKFKDKEKWAAWHQTLREKVLQITVGKQIVAILLARVANGTMPTKSALSAYPEHIVQWVLSGHERG